MVKAKLSRREVEKAISDFANLLKEHNIKLTKLILFGSYRTGTPRDYSDIDLAIISPSFNHKNRFHIQGIIANAITGRKGLITLIEPIGFSVKEYKHADKTTFLGEIKNTGKLISF